LKLKLRSRKKLDVLAGAITERRELLVERLLDADRRVELGSAGRATEAGHVEFRTPPSNKKMLVLSREVALAHVLAELADVVEGADRREAHLARAEGATRRYTHLRMLRGASSPFC